MVENLRIFDPDKDELVTRGSFECKVVGVTLHNADGGDRQEIVRAHRESGTRHLLLPVVATIASVSGSLPTRAKL